MKKIIAITGTIFLLSAGTALAADTAAGATGKSGTTNISLKAVTPSAAPIAKASKNVIFGWNTAGTGYAINTFHASGTKQYGSAFDSTKLYFADCASTDAFAFPTSSIGAEAFADWTPM